MRVVIDTGVFFSAAIKAQTVPNIAVYRAGQRGVLLKSRSTEAELVEVSCDANGDKFLELAANGRAYVIVSGRALNVRSLVGISFEVRASHSPSHDRRSINARTRCSISLRGLLGIH